MKLFYVPGACSLANHIALIEAGLAYELVPIDRQKRTTPDGRDFSTINPKGYVPTLELDDGTVLTENLAILAFIADRAGSLLPKQGLPHFRVLEATAFMTSEIHGNFKPFFYPDASQEEKDRARKKLIKHFGTLAEQLGDRAFLVGDHLTIADTYLFVMLRWAAHHGIEVPSLFEGYSARLKQLPSVARALTEEGLA